MDNLLKDHRWPTLEKRLVSFASPNWGCPILARSVCSVRKGGNHDNMGRLIDTSTQYTFLPRHNFQAAYGYDAASNCAGGSTEHIGL